MPARHHSGPPTGGQTGTTPTTGTAGTTGTTTGKGHTPPDATTKATEVATWLDTVVSTGTITADGTQTARLTAVSTLLDEVIAANGTELAPGQERMLDSLVHDLQRVAQRGDATVKTPDGSSATLLGQAEQRLETFLADQGSTLSDAAKAKLTEALGTLQTVYADGTVTTEERASVATAATVVSGVVTDDFVKLSEAGLTALQTEAAQIDTLLSTGSLTLTAEQRAAAQTADAAVQALIDAGTVQPSALHTALESLYDAIPGAVVDVSGPLLHGHGGDGFFL